MMSRDESADTTGLCWHICDSGYFDRTLCAEPCGAMHPYCDTCGKRTDPCAHESADLADLADLAAHPDPTPEPDAGDVEALAKGLHRGFHASWNPSVSLDLYADSDIWRAQAAAILVSDWLAAHDAEVARTAAKEAGERIAQAIEAIPVVRTPGGGSRYRDRRSPSAMRSDAAAIAREQADR